MPALADLSRDRPGGDEPRPYGRRQKPKGTALLEMETKRSKEP
jgi:hypothetical protein